MGSRINLPRIAEDEKKTMLCEFEFFNNMSIMHWILPSDNVLQNDMKGFFVNLTVGEVLDLSNHYKLEFPTTKGGLNAVYVSFGIGPGYSCC